MRFVNYRHHSLNELDENRMLILVISLLRKHIPATVQTITENLNALFPKNKWRFHDQKNKVRNALDKAEKCLIHLKLIEYADEKRGINRSFLLKKNVAAQDFNQFISMVKKVERQCRKVNSNLNAVILDRIDVIYRFRKERRERITAAIAKTTRNPSLVTNNNNNDNFITRNELIDINELAFDLQPENLQGPTERFIPPVLSRREKEDEKERYKTADELINDPVMDELDFYRSLNNNNPNSNQFAKLIYQPANKRLLAILDGAEKLLPMQPQREATAFIRVNNQASHPSYQKKVAISKKQYAIVKEMRDAENNKDEQRAADLHDQYQQLSVEADYIKQEIKEDILSNISIHTKVSQYETKIIDLKNEYDHLCELADSDSQHCKLYNDQAFTIAKHIEKYLETLCRCMRVYLEGHDSMTTQFIEESDFKKSTGYFEAHIIVNAEIICNALTKEEFDRYIQGIFSACDALLDSNNPLNTGCTINNNNMPATTEQLAALTTTQADPLQDSWQTLREKHQLRNTQNENEVVIETEKQFTCS